MDFQNSRTEECAKRGRNVGKISGVVGLVKVKGGPVVDHQTGEMPTLRGWKWEFGRGDGRIWAARAEGRSKWKEAKHTDPAPVDR